MKLPIRISTVLLLASLVLQVSCLPTEEGKVKYWLTILHNNDGESHLLRAPDQENFGGVARFCTLVNRLRNDAQKSKSRGSKSLVVMLSSGDNFLASPEFQVSLMKGVPYYDSIAMSQIGYDAICLGNHDFDFGPDVLSDFILGFSKPVSFLSANLDFREEPALQEQAEAKRLVKSLVVRQSWTAIGIIGATTPRLPFLSSPRKVAVDQDVRAAIQDEVDSLTERGVKIIVLISHLQNIQEDMTLSRMLKGVDIMVAGGGDELLANPGTLLIPGDEKDVFGTYPLLSSDASGERVPVITTSGGYRYLGRFVAGFDMDGKLIRWNESKSGPVRVAGGNEPDAVPPDPDVYRDVTVPLQSAIDAIESHIIAVSEVPINGVRKDLRSIETNQGNLVADAMLAASRKTCEVFGAPTPRVALLNAGAMRNDRIIPTGNLNELDTFTMLPYSNFITVVPAVTPTQFKEILENAVSRVESGDGRFAQVSGFSFVWDPDGTAQELDANFNVIAPGTRIKEIKLEDGTLIVSGGAIVTGAPDVIVSTIDFLARGGDQYPFRENPFTILGVTYQQALRYYITNELAGRITAAAYPEQGSGRIRSD
jgi:5'-nucleotidase